MDSLKIIFAGTPQFSVPTLKALIATGHDIRAVYTQPDRPAGRGRKLTVSAIKKTALDAGLQVLQPTSLRQEATVRILRAHEADLMVVVAYGLLLPQAVLDTPALGCVNVHASLLPRWRGAAPIQRCILAGDRHSGVTIMGMEAGLDTGPMYLSRRIPLADREDAGSLHDKLAALGASALCEALPGIAGATLVPSPQNDALATYAKKLTKEEALIDWTRAAPELDRMVRAFNPWPVAQTKLGDRMLRLWGCDLPPASDRQLGPPGSIIRATKAGIEVATGDGRLRITRLQLAGKRPMAAADLLSGHPLREGDRLG